MNWLRHILLLTVIVLQPWSLMADDGSPGDVLTPADTIRIPAAQIQPLNSIDETTSASTVVPSFAPVTVTGGGAMTLVSPHSVVLKPGTRVEAGGRLVVKVTANHESKKIKKKIVQVKAETLVPVKTVASIEVEKTFRVYPMPLSGTIAETMSEVKGVLPVRLRISEYFLGFIYLKNVNFLPIDIYRTALERSNVVSMGWREQSETICVMRT